MTGIDAMDATIINMLREDGKLQNTDLARRLDVSEAAIRKRLARLLRDGIIRHFVWAEPLKVGYSHYVTVDIQADPGQIERLAERLAAMQETSFVGICIGAFDVRVSIFGKSIDDVHDKVMRVAKVEGVRATTTTSVTKVIKRDYNFLVEADGAGPHPAGPGSRDLN